MEILAFVNGLIQIGVILVASLRITDAARRRLVLALAGASLICSVAGLLLRLSPALPNIDLASRAASWLVYAAIGLAMLLALASGWRGAGRMRLAWPQGRYQRYRKYQSYRRI